MHVVEGWHESTSVMAASSFNVHGRRWELRMKRLFIFGFLLIVSIFMIVSCASKPTVELVQASAQIVTDISLSGQTGIMDGNKLIKYVTPTVLSYTFIVKNTGSNKIGDTQKPVKFKLEPN